MPTDSNGQDHWQQRTVAAAAFVRTVVVLDDHEVSQSEDDTVPREVVAPLLRPKVKSGGGPLAAPERANAGTEEEVTDKGAQAPEAEPDDATTEEPADGEVGGVHRLSHELDVRALNAAFAKLGIVCSVLIDERAGKRKDDWLQKVHALAPRADVLILDWSLSNDNGRFCTEIISSLAAENPGSRRQLVVVYTGSNDEREIEKGLKGIDGQPGADLRFRLPGGVDVVVVQKPHATGDGFYSDSKVEEASLPCRVLQLFGELSGGLLANASMHGLGALRDSTHELLRDLV